jgi:serine/threonine protein kinase
MAVKYLIIPRSQHDDETTQLRFRKLLREIENFRKLWQHPNIVDFYGICVYEGQALICMELMDLSLKHLYINVHKSKENVPEELVGYVAVKMIDAMVFCKSHGFIHRDIKPSNILVNYR